MLEDGWRGSLGLSPSQREATQRLEVREWYDLSSSLKNCCSGCCRMAGKTGTRVNTAQLEGYCSHAGSFGGHGNGEGRKDFGCILGVHRT